MLQGFYEDLQKAKGAENLVKEVFSALSNQYVFEDVANIKEYRYRGDIKATHKESGREIFIEVKDDSRIADTNNVLCEEENYIKDGGYWIKGNMQSNYDVFCVVSQENRKIYVIDFSILKKNYKKGRFKVIPHLAQDTYCYLVGLDQVKKWGAMIDIVEY